MKLNFFLFLSLLTIKLTTPQLFDMRPKTVRVDRLDGMCKEYKHLNQYFKDLKVTLNNRATVLNGKVVITADYDGDMKLKLSMKRCPSKEQLDSCESYQTITVHKLCDLIKPDGKQPWTPFIKKVRPPLSCPLKKGTYVAKNGTFDGSAFAAFPVSGWYWKVTAKVLNEETDAVLMCIYLEGQIIPI